MKNFPYLPRSAKRCHGLLSLFLMLSLVLTCFPSKAFAATTIDLNYLAGIDFPCAGESPDFDATPSDDGTWRFATLEDLTSCAVEDAAYFHNGIHWYSLDSSNNKIHLSETDILTEDTDYYCEIVVFAEDDYEFKTLSYNIGSSLGEAASTEYNGSYIHIVSAALPAKHYVSQIDFSGIDIPLVGASPDFVADHPSEAGWDFATKEELDALGFSSSDGYKNGISWFRYDASSSLPIRLTSDDIFEEGVQYHFSVAVTLKDGYEFSPSFQYSIDNRFSVAASVVEGRTFHLVTIGQEASLVPPQTIGPIDLTGLDMPVAGAHPDFVADHPEDALWSFTTPDSFTTAPVPPSEHCVNGISWFRLDPTGGSDSIYLSPEDTFEEGVEYHFCVLISLDDRYPLADDFNLSYNGKTFAASEEENYCLFAVTVGIPCAPSTFTILDGKDTVYKPSTEKDMTVRASGPMEQCTGVKIDGSLIDPANYTLSSGSTIVTIKSAFLATLSEGEHTLSVMYDDQAATTKFTIAKKDASSSTPQNESSAKNEESSKQEQSRPAPAANSSTVPQTGEANTFGVWVSLLVTAALALTVLMAQRKRPQKKVNQ